jgi:hypothetical protein
MSELRLTYDLAGYNFKAALAFVYRWSIPAWRRHAITIFLLVIALSYVVLYVADFFGFENSLVYFPFVLVAGGAGLIYVGVSTRKLAWRAVSEGALRKGPTRMTANEDGVKIENAAYTATIRWAAILDAIQGPDGLLLLVGRFEAFSIPASAFDDKVAEAEALEFLRSRLSASEVFA